MSSLLLLLLGVVLVAISFGAVMWRLLGADTLIAAIALPARKARRERHL